jgi:hypothetical protein
MERMGYVFPNQPTPHASSPPLLWVHRSAWPGQASRSSQTPHGAGATHETGLKTAAFCEILFKIVAALRHVIDIYYIHMYYYYHHYKIT